MKHQTQFTHLGLRIHSQVAGIVPLLLALALLLSAGSAFAQAQAALPERLEPVAAAKDHGQWCSGDLLLDQAPNLSFSLWSETTCPNCIDFGIGTFQVLADDFLLDQDTLVTEVVIWGWYFPNNEPPPRETWTVIFHSDGSNPDGNVPQAGEIASRTAVPVSRTATGRTAIIAGQTVDEMRWLLRLAEPVRLTGGWNWIQAYHDSPVADADTSIGFADQDTEGRGDEGSAVLTETSGEWSVRANELALQVCGQRAEWDGLMLPGYRIDTQDASGPTSFLAVRNISDQAVEVNVAYYGQSLADGPLRVDPLTLAPRQTHTRNLRSDLSGLDPDADGMAAGFVIISEAGANEAERGAGRLTGDVLRVDFANDFATGERLLSFDDFCPRQEVRFVDFGSGSEFNVVLRSLPVEGPTMRIEIYDEAGNLLSLLEAFGDSQVLRLDIEELVSGQSFGTLVFDFSPSQGGVVTGVYSAFGRFSTELRGACRP